MACVLMAAGATTTARSTPAEASSANLARYQGAPFNTLLADPVVNHAMAQALGPARLAALTATGAAALQFSKPSLVGNYLIAHGYRPLHGFDDGAVVFVDVRSGNVQVCWTEARQDFWLATTAPARALYRDACINDTETLLPKFGV
jgi:hypothetical protein